MNNYPITATERFDEANFHIKYCLSTLKKYIKGNILEVGAGCGSFTRNYYNDEIKNITLGGNDKRRAFGRYLERRISESSFLEKEFEKVV